MIEKRIFLIVMFLIILVGLSISVCAASESSFTIKTDCFLPVFYIRNAFCGIGDYIVDAGDVLTRYLFEIPKPQHSNIFKTIDEINRSIAETSTCL